jgi:hypothetical protein
MKLRYPIGQRMEQGLGQFSPLGHMGQQVRCGKAAHHHHPVDHIANIPVQRAIRPGANGANIKIEIGRGPPVERQFGAASILSRRQRREIEIAQIHRPLELENLIARQKDHRAMRVDPFHTIALRL